MNDRFEIYAGPKAGLVRESETAKDMDEWLAKNARVLRSMGIVDQSPVLSLAEWKAPPAWDAPVSAMDIAVLAVGNLRKTKRGRK